MNMMEQLIADIKELMALDNISGIFGDWTGVIQNLSINQNTLDAVAVEMGFQNSASMIQAYRSPLDVPEDLMDKLVETIMALVPEAQGRDPNEVRTFLGYDVSNDTPSDTTDDTSGEDEV